MSSYYKYLKRQPPGPRPMRPRLIYRRRRRVHPQSRPTSLENLPPNLIREIGRHLSVRNRTAFMLNRELRRNLQPNLTKNFKRGVLAKLAVLKTKLKNSPNNSNESNYPSSGTITSNNNKKIRKISVYNITKLENLVNNKTKSFKLIGNKNLFLKVGYGGRITVAKRDKTYTPQPNRKNAIYYGPVYSYKSGYEVLNNKVNKLNRRNLINLGRNRIF